MSSIEKLSIQGIRSFGPSAEDMQSLSFMSPLTLIVGENGCGKTTIIECLKYALTGESPPGSERGKSFIHDPKIFERSDALGQIKLQVNNLRGERLSICRSMKISMKRGKYVFGTLDSTVNSLSTGKAGNVESVSKRVADADATMSEFMGVSKAIINNVLFCHQEDSSWPLDEAKKLKEKFDAIFGTTEYNRAIDDFIKLRKAQSEELKLLESNLLYLTHLKEEMESKTLALESAQAKLNKIEEQRNQCDKDMLPINERLQQIREVELDVGKQQAKKVEMETRSKSLIQQIQSLQDKIKTPFTGDLAELEQELEDFDNKMCVKQAEQEEQSEQLNGLRSQEKQLRLTLAELDKKQNEISQKVAQERHSTKQRAEKIQALCAQLKKTCSSTLKDEKTVLDALQIIAFSIKNEKEELATHTQKSDVDDQKRQEEIDNLRVEITKLEQQISAVQQQQKSQLTECTALESKMREVDKSTKKLQQLQADIEKITVTYEELLTKFNREDIRTHIDSHKQRVVQLQQQFKNIDARLTQLNVISKQLVEISLKEQELQKKELEVRRLKSKHGDNMKNLLPNVEQNYKRSLQQVYEKLQREIENMNKSVNKQKQQEQSLQMSRKNLKEDIQRLEKEKEECNEKIKTHCRSSRPYEQLVEESKVIVDKFQLEYGALRSAEALYKKYLHKMVEDPFCPLCHKNLESHEISDLSAELQDEIQQLPENMKRAERLLKVEEQKYERLLKLQPVIERVKLLAADIPKRKQELQQIEEQLDSCVSEYEVLQMSMAEPNVNFGLVGGMMGDMSLLDEALKEVNRLQQELQRLKQRLPEDHDSSVSMEDLQLEKSTVAAELEQARKVVEKKQLMFEKFNEELQTLREHKNKLKDEQIKIQESVQNLPQLKERHQLLNKQLEEGKTVLQEARGKVQPLKQQLNSAVAEKARQKENNRKQLTQMQQILESHRNAEQEILRLHKEVQEYQKLQLDKLLIEIEKKVEIKNAEISKKNKTIDLAVEKLENIRKEFINQGVLERDLKDNRELKILEKEMEQLKEQYDELKRLLGDLDFRHLTREKSDLMKRYDETTANRGKLMGQLGEVRNQIEKLQEEISEPKFKNSLGNHKRALYEVEVTKKCIADLGQYRIALEWALMQFHKEKMDKINSLIREYWRLIYRGNDIDYIQIQTTNGDEQVSESTTSTAMDRRRSYNYRVVQSKNNAVIEMRGRCSAGQRVLASLIIRMALAETFSANCGVLALDEPTTNLDRVNIISLCDALNRIVDERQTQCNFMLIIITHDEEFISMLGKVDSYYRVFRNDQCKSVIRLVQNY